MRLCEYSPIENNSVRLLLRSPAAERVKMERSKILPLDLTRHVPVIVPSMLILCVPQTKRRGIFGSSGGTYFPSQARNLTHNDLPNFNPNPPNWRSTRGSSQVFGSTHTSLLPDLNHHTCMEPQTEIMTFSSQTKQLLKEKERLKASGVTVNDAVIKVFNEMKVRKSSTPEEIKKRKKAVLFCLSPNKKEIVVEDTKQILVGDIGEAVEDPYRTFVNLLPLDDCRYGLYDATYETKESKKEDLVFIFWAPDNAPLKSKMIYASSKDAIKKKFTGIKHEWQVNGLDDIKDRCTLADKLGGNVVVSLEGVPLK
ncbi:hypothetical protein XELAEV_18041042mg [Xenopus laevis]|uniref:ADF-H domain-containing protein n=2 Tax=Xenopus laevis TaxID=8355 RepID=A0A974H4P8_XENLA|nr:hypothetical protein XELAEV_18041042mg [Xenopus laevis]